MKAYLNPIDVLEVRLKLLEDRVFGKTEKTEIKTSVMNSLMVINSQIVNALTGREQVTAVLKRMNELEEYLDPSYGDEIPLTAKSKLDVILSIETELEKNLKCFQLLQQLKPVLDSENIINVPTLQGTLDKLIVIELAKKERFDNVSKEIQEMMQHYNDIVSTLSKSFVKWDAALTKYEMDEQVKKHVE